MTRLCKSISWYAIINGSDQRTETCLRGRCDDGSVGRCGRGRTQGAAPGPMAVSSPAPRRRTPARLHGVAPRAPRACVFRLQRTLGLVHARARALLGVDLGLLRRALGDAL